MSDSIDPALLTPIQKLTKDLREASRTLGPAEARFLVDAYYKIQEDRIRSAHQVRTLSQATDDKAPEPHDTIAWLFTQEQTLENQIKAALDVYGAGQPAGVWMRSVVGIGPVITAGFLAHIYMGDWCAVCHGHNPAEHDRRSEDKEPGHPWNPIISCPTVGQIWRFCGLDPTVKWDKGTKRPWNASLKRLCWIVGESFTKVSNHPDDTYGKLYQQRKEREIARNEAGDYAEQAAASLTAKRFGDDTAAKKHYLAGKLPPARIHLRAQRWAVKVFLSHFHEVLYFTTYGERPPKPYVLDHVGGHAHKIEVPNAHLVPGLKP
jgi:hypothetical protein